MTGGASLTGREGRGVRYRRITTVFYRYPPPKCGTFSAMFPSKVEGSRTTISKVLRGDGCRVGLSPFM